MPYKENNAEPGEKHTLTAIFEVLSMCLTIVCSYPIYT